MVASSQSAAGIAIDDPSADDGGDHRRRLSCQPSNGVFFDFDTSLAASNGGRQIRREDRDVGRRSLVERAARHVRARARD